MGHYVATEPLMSRIIAGAARGLTLASPRGERTRPTTDRTKEAVFSTLVSWAGPEQLAGLSFLDLFAGSGSVGLEAASRGADRVVLVENHPATAQLIRRNADAVRRAVPGCTIEVVTATAQAFLGRSASPAERFDVIWADPPYALPNADIAALLGQVLVNGWLADDGLVVVERSARGEPFAWPDALGVQWDKDYGETRIRYARADIG